MFVIGPVRYFTVVVLAVALGLALVGSALRVSADDPATFSVTHNGSFVITFGQVTSTVDFSSDLDIWGRLGIRVVRSADVLGNARGPSKSIVS